MTTIGGYAFNKCDSLISIKVPLNVNNIEVGAFSMGTLLTIYNNSYAHRYCEDNSKPYTLLILNGDVDVNGIVDITDVILLKRHLIAGNGTNWILTGENLEAADMNENGKVDISDLVLLKREVA